MWNSRNKILNDNDGDDVAFLSSGSRDKKHGLYRETTNDDDGFYHQGRVVRCTKNQAISLFIFVLSFIFVISLMLAFFRPFNNCQKILIDSANEEQPDDTNVPIATNGEEFPWNDIRLPSFLLPIRYDIELTPNLTNCDVKGIEKLIFMVTEKTNFIVFHSKLINITSRTINERLKVERMLEYIEHEQIYLETDDYMIPGTTYALRIKFEYQLTHTLEGFYLSSYKQGNGKEVKLASSHFEPTYARLAFPCFDEPGYKTKFLMTIIHDKDLVAFFNTPKREVSEVRGKPNQIRDEFEETVEMSTYLVAFVICDFTLISQFTKSKVNVSIITAKDKINQAHFALDSAVQIMEYYDEFFGIPYPLPKEDLIAIPDFGAGAMENWGLITYRETSLLYSENETSTNAQQWIAVVIAHELAHQWFGNLVTMKWWNDLWLNEGFASWLEYKGVEHIQPEWRMKDQFFFDVTFPALELDSLSTSHPVSVIVEDPKEIESIFDVISYKKGASIIQMLEDFVGETVLQNALNKYLKVHQFSNAETKDFWRAISESWTNKLQNKKIDETTYSLESMSYSTNVNIEELMNSWTLQMGYPLITFERLNNSFIYKISQSRFMKAYSLNDSKSKEQDSDSNYKWIVPLSFHSNIKKVPEKMILNQTHSIEIEFPADTEWFKANVNATGFYRVMYPMENWEALIKLLRTDHTLLSASDRAQIINDAFGLSNSGYLSTKIPLEMIKYMKEEREFLPWAIALSHLGYWKSILRETNILDSLNYFILDLIKPLYNELGWSSKGSHMTKLLRKFILDFAWSSNLQDAKQKARAFYTNYRYHNISINSDIRLLSYTAGIHDGNVQDWEFGWSQYNNNNLLASESSLWMTALAASSSVYHLQQYLEATMKGDTIRIQDVSGVLNSISANPAGGHLVWRHLQINWNALLKTFGTGSFAIGSIIESTISHFSTNFDLEAVNHFFKNKNVGSGKRALEQSIEKIRGQILWRETQEALIRQWLLSYKNEN